MTYEAWGCEYLDPSPSAPASSWNRPEPWRVKYPNAFLVPREFIRVFINEYEVNEKFRFEEGVIAALRNSIRFEGLYEPVIMIFDDYGKFRFHDGHHRWAAIDGISDFLLIPVRLQRSEGVIKGHNQEFKNVVPEMLRALQ